ncbi:MAG: hypothetical protein ACLTC8_01865 [Lachnospiraceae bacterium]
MRKSIDGLCAVVKDQLEYEPLPGQMQSISSVADVVIE